MKKLNFTGLLYRSEIDGLRTVAVLSIILYHANIVVFGHDFFKGGFVGVDIFFVISGYLISRILLYELFEKSRINFTQFYERRARRILPILFTVFIISFPLAYKYLLPPQFIEYTQSMLSAIFFGSNIYFYFTNVQYGAADSLLQPLLHTWSLGVEEQFYILFPIILILIYRFAKKNLIIITAVLILFSLQYADYQSTKNTQLNFFMISSRIWELGIGTLLAFYELKYGRIKHKLLNQTIPLLGFCLISFAIVSFNKQTPHPSFITLLPTLGTALIILYSHNKSDLIGKILSIKPIVGIGLISYSMYLWHYPIFSFARIIDTNGLHNDEKYLLIVVSIVLSVISYFIIEKPFRNKKIFTTKEFSVAILALLIILLTMSFKVIETKGFEDRMPKILTKDKILNIFGGDEEVYNRLKGDDGKPCYKREDNFCEFGNNKKGHINIVGDSHLASIESNLVERLEDNYSFTSLNHTGCWVIKDTFRYNDTNKNIVDINCGADYQNKRIEKINENPNSIIVVGGRLPLILTKHFFDNEEGGKELNAEFYKRWQPPNGLTIEEAIQTTLLDLMNEGHKVILLYPLVEAGWHVPEKLYNSFPVKTLDNMTDWVKNNIISTSYDVYKKRTRTSFELLDGIKHSNLYRLYPHRLLCNNQIKGRCITHDDINIFYFDDDHPSNEGAKLINNLIIEKIKEFEGVPDLE